MEKKKKEKKKIGAHVRPDIRFSNSFPAHATVALYFRYARARALFSL